MNYKDLPKVKPNKQVQEYLDALSKGGRLVMPKDEGWYVVSPDDRKSLFFDTKEVAVIKAEQELAGTKSKVFIFDNDGELVDSYTPQN